MQRRGCRLSGQQNWSIRYYCFDEISSAPITRQAENLLVPAESLYAVIEVKSHLNRREVLRCLQASAKVRALRPFMKPFVSQRAKLATEKDNAHRVLYVVFAFESDLSGSDWLVKEYRRLQEVSDEHRLDVSTIDRMFVFGKGIINPVRGHGREVNDDEEVIFAELLLHLVNFAQRERSRRPVIDWSKYSLPNVRGWRKIRLS